LFAFVLGDLRDIAELEKDTGSPLETKARITAKTTIRQRFIFLVSTINPPLTARIDLGAVV
jgi:hypothetical protein